MKLISWNICQGNSQDDSQDRKLIELNPDIVALQEVNDLVVPRLKKSLESIGLDYFHTTSSGLPSNYQPAKHRGRGVFLASRWPFKVLSSEATGIDLKWSERLISVRIEHPDFGPVEIHNVYVPHSRSTFLEYKEETNEYCTPAEGADSIMTQTLDALYKGLARDEEKDKKRILCGDFNMPEAFKSYFVSESDDQEKLYSNQAKAEKKILVDLSQYDLTDVYKVLHPTRSSGQSVYSHVKYNKNHEMKKYLIDFIFASKSLNVVQCDYLTDIIGGVLGDHTPVMAVFDPSKLN